MVLVRWKFDDLATAESYTVPINPSDATGPSYQKKILYQATAAPDGSVLVFEGRDDPQKIEFSGVILDQAHYDAFVSWWKRRNQIRLTDDLGRQFICIFESFAPVRKRNAIYPYKHDYKATVILLRSV